MKNLLVALLFLPAILQSQSDYAFLMVDQLQIMLYRYDSTSNARMGFMDAKGKVVIEPKYVSCSDFKHGIANVIRPDGTYGIIDKSGKETWFPGYEKVYFYGDDIGIAGKEGKWGFLNKKGEIVIPAKYDMAFAFTAGLGYVKQGKRTGFVDKNGREVIPLDFEEVWEISEGMIRFATSQK